MKRQFQTALTALEPLYAEIPDDMIDDLGDAIQSINTMINNLTDEFGTPRDFDKEERQANAAFH